MRSLVRWRGCRLRARAFVERRECDRRDQRGEQTPVRVEQTPTLVNTRKCSLTPRKHHVSPHAASSNRLSNSQRGRHRLSTRTCTTDLSAHVPCIVHPYSDRVGRRWLSFSPGPDRVKTFFGFLIGSVAFDIARPPWANSNSRTFPLARLHPALFTNLRFETVHGCIRSRLSSVVLWLAV